MKPKFTDAHRFPHGYVKAEATDVRKTFERVRRQREANRREAQAKVAPIAQRRKA
jgi:hypothetical protein